MGWWLDRRFRLALASRAVDLAAAAIEAQVDDLGPVNAETPDDMVSVCLEELASIKGTLRDIASDLANAVDREPEVGA